DLELVDRERQAIESEFSLKLKDDIRRVYQVQKETVNPKHPFSKFSVGNQTTLAGKQADIRDELLAFYQQHYSANIMTLCVVAPRPIAELDTIVKKYFSNIINRNVSKHYPQEAMITKDQRQKHIQIVPLKDQKRVSICFSLPEIDQFYKRKPLTFISHLLGNESPGSLLSYLKVQGLANNLSAGGGVNGYNFKDYSISIQLTDKGFAELDEVVTCVFEYIELIKQQGVQAWRYQERANLLDTAFRFQEQIKTLDLASHLSINMHHYDIEDIIYGDYRMDEMLEDETIQLLSMMSTTNMRLLTVAKESQVDTQAKWYDTPYQVRSLQP
ncbi:insulinase family protein, partial [Shewanella sp. SR41-2]|nr:insulinase family protein [Shewanella sp. SR41-2]